MRLIVIGAALALAVAVGQPSRAQTPEDRMAAAVALALRLGEAQVDRQEVIRRLNDTLTAILAEHPASPTARALLAPLPGGQTSLLQEVQARLAPATDPLPPLECTAEPVILDLAERILAQRGDLPGFSGASYGGIATYLWLHYAKPDAVTAFARLQRIMTEGRRPPRDLDTVALVWAIATMGVDRGFEAFGTPPATGFAGGDTNVWRAVLLADDGDSFFRLLSRVREEAALSEAFAQRWFGGRNFASLLVDLDDARKLRLAERAEAAGEIMFAGQLLASRTDADAYRAFIAAHPGNELLQSTSPDWSGLRMHSAVPIEPAPTQTFRQMPQDMFDAFRAAFHAGEGDFTMIVMNQTGWDKEVGAAGRAFLAELDAGRLRTVGNLERNWLFLYDAIAAQVTAERLRPVMTSFDVSPRTRHYAGRAQPTVDWMRAVMAVSAFVTGSGPAPQRPANLSPDFPWTLWLETAAQIRQGSPPANPDPEQAKMAVEILASADRPADAIAYAEKHLNVTARLAFYRDLMQRLDRTCGGHTVSVGQGILLGGAVAYRF